MPRSTTRDVMLSVLILVSAASAQGGFPPVPVPAGNPMTPDKVLLGKALFFEEQVSSTNTVACATCHTLERGGSDPRSELAGSVHPGLDGLRGTRDDIRGSRGVIANAVDGSLRATPNFGLAEQVTGRRGMPVINAAFAPLLFWDGRASNVFRDPSTNAIVLTDNAALESQAVGPPVNDVEMAHLAATWSDVVANVTAARPLALASNIPAALAQFVAGRTYPQLFNQVFGTPAITPARIAMAIATYERTLVSNQSPFDQGTMTPQQQRGQQLFFNNVNECSDCHGGPLFASPAFRYTGVTPQNEDLGRFLVTNANQDRGRMRAPTLRNVELRAPFFHNGSARTLRDVVDFYARGGDFNAANRDGRIRPLGLSTADRDALVAFLQALTDPRVRNNQPPFDRPTLFSESTRVPSEYGGGTAGGGNIVPAMVANEPPHIGHGRFAIGLAQAAGGSPVALLLDVAANRTGTPVLGIMVHVAMSPAMVVIPDVVSGSGNGAGWTSSVLPVPPVPDLRGQSVFGQWIVGDVSTGSLAASRAVEFTIF